MSTAKRRFALQPSRFALGLQLLVLGLISVLAYLSMGWMMAVLSLLAMTGSGWWWSRQPRINHFEYLHDQQWSIGCAQSGVNIQRCSIDRIIDHHCYIVIYFSGAKPKNLVIWYDQLSSLQWKNLKILAKTG